MSAVSQNIFHELDFFAVSFLLGVFLVLVYDCLRIFRRLVRHGTFLVSLEDFGYWVATAFAVFAMLYQKNDGLIRGFSIGGVVLGMLLYNHLVSRYTVRYLALFLQKVIRIVEKLLGAVLYPWKKLARWLLPKRAFFAGKTKRVGKYFKKRLKKLRNEIKMGISK